MSTLQVANLHFDTTANNRIQLGTTNSFSFVAGGVVAATVNSTAMSVPTLALTNTFSIATANVVSQTLTDGATISWNTASGQIATVTLGGNRVFAGPTNLKIGTYVLNVIQDGTGSRTGDFSNTVFKFPGGVKPTLTTTANARDIIFFYSDGTNMYGSFLPDVK